jgi:hypothetical protein
MTRRIERAMALLRRGDLSLTEVCFAGRLVGTSVLQTGRHEVGAGIGWGLLVARGSAVPCSRTPVIAQPMSPTSKASTPRVLHRRHHRAWTGRRAHLASLAHLVNVRRRFSEATFISARGIWPRHICQ